MKGIKQNAREIAELKTAANIEKEAVDLRAVCLLSLVLSIVSVNLN